MRNNLVTVMDKSLALEIIKLLSALESWGFSAKERMPQPLLLQLNDVTETLTAIVLDDGPQV